MIYEPTFLEALFEQKIRTIFARVTALTLDEKPVDIMTGKVTSGSINLDGKSAVRRSCSLSLVLPVTEFNNVYWTLNTKFALEIGLTNNVDKNYPNTIWFKMGTYILTSFSTNLTTNNMTVSISGKDKMCLLNGEIGGIINSEVDFGTYDYTDADGTIINNKYPIKDIITDAVHFYALEPIENIIINDLDTMGLEQLDYKYDVPLFLLRLAHTNSYIIPILGGDKTDIDIILEDGSTRPLKLNNEEIIYDNLLDAQFANSEQATRFYLSTDINHQYKFCAAKLTYGEAVGYRPCDLVYAGDLIAKPGDSLTSILDKIVKMLGEFEYFYNLEGQFIFRRKPSYVNTLWTPQNFTANDEMYVTPLATATNLTYNFKNNNLIISLNRSLQINNLKNDFTVRGERSNKTQFMCRYAINKKPTRYVDYNGNIWTTYSAAEYERLFPVEINENKVRAIYCDLDWRELIYRMAIDYRAHERNLEDELARNGKSFQRYLAELNAPYYPTGFTGYEQFYTDIEGFWRQLYFPLLSEKDIEKATDYSLTSIDKIDFENRTLDNIYIKGIYRPNFEQVKLYTNAEKLNYTLSAGEVWGEWSTHDLYYHFRPEQIYYIDTEYQGFNINSTDTFLGQELAASHYTWNDREYSLLECIQQGIVYTTQETKNIASLYRLEYNDVYNTSNFVPWLNVYNYSSQDADGNYQNSLVDQRNHYALEFDPITNLTTYTPIGIVLPTNRENTYTLTDDSQHIWYLREWLKILRILYDILFENRECLLESDIVLYANNNLITFDESADGLNIKNLLLEASDVDTQIEIIENTIDNLENDPIISQQNLNYILFTDYLNELSDNTFMGKAAHPAYNNSYIYDNENYYPLTLLLNTNILEAEQTFFTELLTDIYGRAILNGISKTNILYFIKKILFETEPGELQWWRKDLFTSIESMNFWLEFLDTDGEISNYSVTAIGDRPKVIKESNIQSIFYRNIPKLIFTTATELLDIQYQNGYGYILLGDGYENLFSISTRGLSAKNRIDELLQTNTYATQTINITALPIYTLDANQRIQVDDTNIGIKDQYAIQSLSFNLAHGGTMSISATKIENNTFVEREE